MQPTQNVKFATVKQPDRLEVPTLSRKTVNEPKYFDDQNKRDLEQIF